MKRKALVLIFTAVFFVHTAAASEVTVMINGKDINAYNGIEPYIENDIAMIPIHAVAKTMGAEVLWNRETREVSVNDDIVFQIDKQYAYINNEPVKLDMPAVIVDGYTYVPLRFVSENMGAKVEWNGEKDIINICADKSPVNNATISSGTISENAGNSNTVPAASDENYFGGRKWSAIAEKYKNDASVDKLIFVKYKGDWDADVIMYTKDADNAHGWTKVASSSAYVGKDGIGEASEYVSVTPEGDFGITAAFGIKENPGTQLNYIDVTDSIYACGDREYYNKIIDTSKLDHKCSGEHMIEYVPEYNYGLVLGYNNDGIYGKGSAFFLHCKGKKPYTGGCIAVDEDTMIQMLKYANSDTRICIYNE